jgi:hypothetical protein
MARFDDVYRERNVLVTPHGRQGFLADDPNSSGMSVAETFAYPGPFVKSFRRRTGRRRTGTVRFQ